MITECPPREARGVCPPLPRGDTRKMITECPPREARGVLLAKHGVSACLYHAASDITVCPSHTAQCRNVSITNREISRGVSVTLRCVMLRCVCHTMRYVTQCVRHTPLVTHCAISRGVQSHTRKTITKCPPREAWGCPPREARGVCPPLPCGDTRKTITECPPREARGVLLAKHGVSARLYHAATDILSLIHI